MTGLGLHNMYNAYGIDLEGVLLLKVSIAF